MGRIFLHSILGLGSLVGILGFNEFSKLFPLWSFNSILDYQFIMAQFGLKGARITQFPFHQVFWLNPANLSGGPILVSPFQEILDPKFSSIKGSYYIF